jgi:GT2 family glycosyltransferase/glycosyltransferase involved in cell wall biosynthesis
MRQGIHATVETQPDGTQRSIWEIAEPPLVSVIIPNRNHADMLRCCLSGVLDYTDYDTIEVIIVENRSSDPATWEVYQNFCRRPNVRVVRVDQTFNYSAACNRGAALAKGSLLLFLNNDIEVKNPTWLGELVRAASLPGVGVVGTKLRYPDGSIQHAGVSVGVHMFGMMFHRANEAEWGIFGSSNYTRNWSAITGACQLIRREVFDLIGGFDEGFEVANGDVALCLRAKRAGWRTAYTPFAELIHYEGKTRGRTNPVRDLVRSAREVQRLGMAEDPYLHPQLSGFDAVPRLRALGEDSLHDKLRFDVATVIASAPAREPPLDLFDAFDIASDIPADIVFWPPEPAQQVEDCWSAARWVIDLLRHRTDLRRRFPRALSDGPDGAFAVWLTGEGGRSLHLSETARSCIAAAFIAEPAARARQYYFWREDVRTAFPLALLPAGRRGFTRWILRHREEGQLRLEEVWWLLLQCNEDPSCELVCTYLFTPAWQEAYPDGLTRFGRDRFSAWLSTYYDLPEDTEWLNTRNWPVHLSHVEEIRLAYAAREEWRLAHPHAFWSEREARAFLTWLTTDASGLFQETRAWCAARLQDETAAELVAPGANIIGHFCYISGLRVSAECIVDAIETAGGAVARRDMRTDLSDEPHHTEYGGLEPHDITIIHVQPEPFFDHAYVRADLAERMPRTYRIAYWYWELEAVPAVWGETALAVDEIWTATNFVAAGLRKKSPVPIRVLLPGVRLGTFVPRSRHAFDLAGREEGRFAFLFSFHMASVMERKNPLGLIRAFRQAFAPEEPVDLVLKITSGEGHSGQVDELRAATAGANISVVDRVLSADETLSLMDACDAYVSLHRSEGLGLTMAEAMLLGKPVIATRYSGNLDFMDDNNSLLVDYDLVPVGRSSPPYDEAAYWAEPSVVHAAQLMRRLWSDRGLARELGAAGKRDARMRLAPAAAGKRITDRCAEIKAAKYRSGQDTLRAPFKVTVYTETPRES